MGFTLTAYANICFSAEHVSNAEMKKLIRDLNEMMTGGVDVDTLIRIWDRLAKTGPHGQSYVSRFKPQFMEAVEAEPVKGP